MTPCEEKDYKVGDWFIVKHEYAYAYHSIVELIKDDGSACSEFKLVKGVVVHPDDEWRKNDISFYMDLSEVEPVAKPKPDKVTIVCEGKEVEISRESAIALNLIDG